MFRISKDELYTMMENYKLTDVTSGNSTSTMIGDYWKKSLKTGFLEMTKIGLLREATRARKNGLVEWSNLVSKWADTI